ncbi:ImmA/IrrE family metallo-endopeptidase [Rhizobium phaseoli]|uniref:ImmA/IrrE family metallo-endopeptidase n=1 Tax=Rhizobium phaseoli TaxID=396 RepID=UPI0007EC0F38|nr:ImmA/IrrE family metallo-endopeptidase [Rhizobium phaseoli]ANL39257.1 hypothetical protein AMC88_CH00824 [Rhizobium phaseoli]ANL58246.1 hypothetical protein AMC85_CH00824 [Rhizobium phaseoli]
MGFRRGFKAEANRIALRVRQQMDLSPHAPIDPIAVCAHFEIELLQLSDVEPESPFLGEHQDAFSAVTVPRGLATAIVHNDRHHPYRQRSNICHELAHCFLGHECAPALLENGDRSRDGGMEAEANFLAGVLLITNEAANRIMLDGLYHQAQGIYGVSKPMLDFRLRVSGAQTIHQRRMGAAGRSSLVSS